MKTFFAFTLASIVATTSLHAAATVDFSAQTFNGVTDASGTALAAGDVVEVGFFNASDSTLQQDAGNYSVLNALFTLYGVGHIGDGAVSGTPGYFADGLTASTGSLGITGKQIYLWIFNGSNPATATQEGIFYFNMNTATTGANHWAFPVDGPPSPGSTSVDLADLTGALSGSGSNTLANGADVVVGSFGPASLSVPAAGINNAKAFQLTPAPEPASAGLALLGGFTLLLARRRKA